MYDINKCWSLLPAQKIKWLKAKFIFMSHFSPTPNFPGSLICLSVCALKVNLLLCLHIRLKELTWLWIHAKPQLAIWGSHYRSWAWRQTYSDCIQVIITIAVPPWDNVGQCVALVYHICPTVNSLWQKPSFLLSAPRNQPRPWTPANQILPPWTPEKLSSVCCEKENKRAMESENS